MAIVNGRRAQWILANVIGIGAFLVLASRSWIEPELANEPGAGAGNFLIWGIFAFPILLFFIAAHLIVIWIALKKFRRGWALPLVVTTVGWIAAAIFDSAHHGL